MTNTEMKEIMKGCDVYEQILVFAKKLEADTVEQFESMDYDTSKDGVHYDASIKVSVRPGNKYCKIDRGTGGLFMVDLEGSIYAIKAYGVINRKKRYGNVSDTSKFFWGNYRPVPISK